MTSNEIQQNHAVPGISISGMDTSMEQLNNPINYFNPFQQNYQNPYSQQFTNSFFQMPNNQNLNQTIDNSEIKDEILDDKESKEEGNLENIQPIQNPLHLKSEQNIGLYHQNPNLFPTYDFGNEYPAQNNFYPNFNFFNSMGNQIPPFWNSNSLLKGQHNYILPQYGQYNFLPNVQPELEETVKEEAPLETSDLGSSMNVTPEFSDNSSFELDQALNLSIKDEELDQVLDLSIKYDSDKKINISNNMNFRKEDAFNQKTQVNHSETFNEETQINHSETEVKTTNSELNAVRRYSEWSTDETLPTGWKKRHYKKSCNRSGNSKRMYQYLSENNEIFPSRSQIVAYMQNCKTYSEDTIQKVLSGKQNNCKKLVENNQSINQFTVEWKEDSALPKGWKTRYSNRYHYFLNSENQKFKTISSAISHMTNSKKYSEDEIEKVRIRYKKSTILPPNEGREQKSSSLVSIEGGVHSTFNGSQESTILVPWEYDELLPHGWKRRYANHHHLFLSPENKRFQSVSSAFNFMKKSDKYSDQEADKILEVGRNQSMKLTQNKSLNCIGIGNKISSDWETDDSMPNGWKRRYANKHHLFVSPENKRFQSLKSAIMFMKASNYSEEDIGKLVKVCQTQSEKLTNNKNAQFIGKY